MSGYDADRTYSVRTSNHKEPAGSALDYPSQTEKLLLDFLLQYRVGSDFIYRYVNILSVWTQEICAHDVTEISYARIFS